MSRLTVVILFCTFLAGPAQADTYRYETEEGVLSFADELKRIPAIYRDRAVKIEFLPLKDYPRLSIVQTREIEERRASFVQNAAKAVEERPVPGVVITAPPFTVYRENRWLPNINGAPGDSYVSVDVLRDGSGREIAVVQAGTGFGRLVYFGHER